MKNIVVGYDGSETAHSAVTEAASLARVTKSALHVVNVVSDERVKSGLITAVESESATEHAVRLNDALLTKPKAQRGIAEIVEGVFTFNKVFSGSAAKMLLEYAKSIDANLIVVGNRRVQGLERLLGSVAMDILRSADCSVYVADTARLEEAAWHE